MSREAKKGYILLRKEVDVWAKGELERIQKRVEEVEEGLRTKKFETYYTAVDAVITTRGRMQRALERIAAREKEMEWMTKRIEGLEYKRSEEVEALLRYIEKNEYYLDGCEDRYDILTYYSFKEKGIIIE